jgi:hypothetical protein
MVLPHPFSTPLGGLGKNSYSKLSSGNTMHISQHCMFNNVNSQMVEMTYNFMSMGALLIFLGLGWGAGEQLVIQTNRRHEG